MKCVLRGVKDEMTKEGGKTNCNKDEMKEEGGKTNCNCRWKW